jgi:DNA-binding MarR family transcriptional regulator
MSTDVELAAALRAAMTRMYLRIGSQVPGLGLTVPQTSCLMTLRDFGPLRMGELSEREHVKLPTVTSLVDKLERLELVERQRDPDDRRAVIAALTPKGRALIEEIAHIRNQHLAELLVQLPEEEKAALRAAIPVLQRLLAIDPQKAPTA